MWNKLASSLGLPGSGEGFRRYFFNTGWLAGLQFFSLLTSFFIGAWVARSLGPGQYGLFSYSLSFAGLFSLLAGLGVDSIIYRDLVRRPEKSRELLGSGLAIKLWSGLGAWLAASGLAWFYIPSGIGRLIVSLVSFSYVVGAFNIIDLLFKARVESKYSAQSQVFAIVVASLLKIVFIITGAGLAWLAAIYLLESVFLAAALLLSYRRRRLNLGWWRPDSKLTKYLLKSSWPLLLSGLSAFALLKVDQVMIGAYLGETAVGLYAAAAKLSEVWYFIPGIICSSLFPSIIQARANNTDLYRQRIAYLYWLLFILGVLIAFLLSGAAGFLVNLLFGESFVGATPIAAIYAWSTIGWFLAGGLWYKLMAENRLKLLFFSSAFLLSANVILNTFFIQRSGIMGAAWATVISYSLIVIFIIHSRYHENSSSGN